MNVSCGWVVLFVTVVCQILFGHTIVIEILLDTQSPITVDTGTDGSGDYIGFDIENAQF